MSNSLFFCSVEKNQQNEKFITMFEDYAKEYSAQMYIINAPLGNEASNLYDFADAIVVLMPKRKVCLINLQQDKIADFHNFCDDFIEDIGHLSKKFEYLEQLGRPREWKDKLVIRANQSEIIDIESFLSCTELENKVEQRNADFLISLLIGSINDISRIGGSHPETMLDEVKKKIILFDGDQSRFIYSQPTTQRRITIQGLAGTGKTELLLHKLKDLYVQSKETKIVFTCFNKILAQSMKKRVPEFFDFMRVEEQIQWEKRLWVMSSWGSRGEANSGIYSYVCVNYNLQFHAFSFYWDFDAVCKEALEQLNKIENFEACFDYILVDESQDFPQSFFDLCEKVAVHAVYLAGDIFQDIYDRNVNQAVRPDYLLNKCYRTDPKTLMFAHAVGMGLYEDPVIRWLDDEEWISCGYQINRSNNRFELSRVPLRRFEDVDMSNVHSIEVLGSEWKDIANNVFSIIDSIRMKHKTVCARDIAIVFMGGNNCSNYELADYIAFYITEKYKWKAVKGYETKDSTSDAVFISNRNNIKGLEFPFVICIVSGRITDDVFLRNTIYMMLTRSFITSYFLVNKINSDFIETYTKAAENISKNGIMSLREPSNAEKEKQNQKVSIAVAKKSRTIKEIIEETINEESKDNSLILTSGKKHRIVNAVLQYVQDEGQMTEKEIQERTRKMISAYI